MKAIVSFGFILFLTLVPSIITAQEEFAIKYYKMFLDKEPDNPRIKEIIKGIMAEVEK